MENTKALNDWYEKLLTVSKVPIIETDMWSKGFYDLTKGKHTIHIKTDIRVSEKIKVLLHEYTHYLHFANYYENESRAECEIIANSTAFFVCRELGLDLYTKQDFIEIYADNPRVDALLIKSMQISIDLVNQILNGYL